MNRPDQLEAWAKRRREIVAHFAKSGSLTETGRAFGMSRQRVHQVVELERKKAGDTPASSDPGKV